MGRYGWRAVVVSLLCTGPLVAAAQERALVLDSYNHGAFVFDTSGARGSVPVTGSGDCAIDHEGRFGFVTDSTSKVWVVDVASFPVGLAPGTNPIPISNRGGDVALTPDGKFLIVGGGTEPGPISVIDLASRTERATADPLGPSGDYGAIDVCADGSVLVGSFRNSMLLRMTIDAEGQLTDTGERLHMDRPFNVSCAPDARSGVAFVDSGYVQSFRVPGLTPVNRRFVEDTFPISGAIARDGRRVFARSWGPVESFPYDPIMAQLGPSSFSFDTTQALTGVGVDGVALDPLGSILYVPEQGQRISRFDTRTGSALPPIVPYTGFSGPGYPQGICLRAIADRDQDLLPDYDEGIAGTDPLDADTDDDGLLDGFEIRYGFDPRTAGDGTADPDQDGLDNVGEQAARTLPFDFDSDDDGLLDGDDIAHGTDPNDSDTDDDRLSDGLEVTGFGTDPLRVDTDRGGASDGDELERLNSDPLDPTDDPRRFGLVVDAEGTTGFVFNEASSGVLGSVPLGERAAYADCAITSDGEQGFLTNLDSRIYVVDLGASPPRLATTNPIAISNAGVGLSSSPDGKFLLACGGYDVAPVSVIDLASRVERSTLALGSDTDCYSVDVCSDGSVLVASVRRGVVLRLQLDTNGALIDTGERLSVPSTFPFTVSCAPDARSGVIVNGTGIHSFRLPGLGAAFHHHHHGLSGAARFSPDGRKLYARERGVDEHDYDPITGTVGDAITAFFSSGGGQFALDRTGARLYVPDPGQVAVYDLTLGESRWPVTNPEMSPRSAIRVCLGEARDRDRDGLADEAELARGTDPDDADSDDDGLLDGFEARQSLDPLTGGDGAGDPDDDGLDNAAEQLAGTDPHDRDSDDDGLTDGAELSRGMEPRDADMDDDELLDGAELEHGTDPLRPDTDGGGATDGDEVVLRTDPLAPVDDPREIGMVMDQFVAGANVVNEASRLLGTAATGSGQIVGDCAISHDGTLGFATNFNSRVSVVDLTSSPPQPAAGIRRIPISNQGDDLAFTPDGRFLLVCGGSVAAPISVVDVATRREHTTFQLGPTMGCHTVDVCRDGSVLVTSRSGQATARLTIDADGVLHDTGERLAVNFPNNVYCAPDGRSGIVVAYDESKVKAFRVPGLTLADEWLVPSNPVSGVFARDGGRFYVRSEYGTVFARNYDLDSSSFGALAFSVEATPIERLTGVEQLALERSGARLYVPEPGRLKVVDAETGELLAPGGDVHFVEPTGVCWRESATPTARILLDERELECTSPEGARVRLDGSTSFDPDSTPGTADDLERFEWLEDLGLPSETLLGTGAVLEAVLPLGTHAITLRVMDEQGHVDSANTTIDVIDTTAPSLLSFELTPPFLAPPNHRLVSVSASLAAHDACSPVSVVLDSVESNEADDAPGAGDGATVGDVRGAALGTQDYTFLLRAERSGGGPGRTYTVRYRLIDEAGNTIAVQGSILVP
jgi:DNA-binding beta-propeller fold protein YncE